jgi:hypothetical protein
MDFLSLYHLIIEELLFESVNRSFLAQLNAEIEVAKSLYRKKDKKKFKDELKVIKKKLIAKLVKENYNSILSKFFPFLRDDVKTTDEDFTRKFFGTTDIWENIEADDFKNLIIEIEMAIDYFGAKNHSQFSNINYLSKNYIKY